MPGSVIRSRGGEAEINYSFTASATGSHKIELRCGDWLRDSDSSYVYAGTTSSGVLYADVSTADCSLTSYAPGGGMATVSFQVQPPVVTVRNLTVGPSTFYPRVRDGYRDRTTIAFTAADRSSARIAIRNSSGGLVWEQTRSVWVDYWSDSSYERQYLTWGGKNRVGNLVPTGTYTVTVTASRNGEQVSDRTTVKVATGTQNRRRTVTKWGWWDSRDSTTDSCYADQWGENANWLSCWGGRYAQASYYFRLPANARKITWGEHGYVKCCKPGQVIKTGERTSRRSYRVRIKVTNWRAYVVRKVWVSYSYTRRI